MNNLPIHAKLKVNKDTFFLPDSNGGVYFRNNASSFRMDGDGIYDWIEKLMPMFNGNYSLAEITDGLPLPYQNRVFEIGEILYENGFVRDANQDAPHELNSTLLDRYASQIEFLEADSHSGALKFETYRGANVLVLGSGDMLTSLVSSLLESGLPTFHYLVTDRDETNYDRIHELIERAYEGDNSVLLQEIDTTIDRPLREVFEPFDWILYVSQNGDIDGLKTVHTICRETKKNFIPAICLSTLGIAGPVVTENRDECWESAWHRLHETTLQNENSSDSFSPITSAMLANVIVFELFKHVADDSYREKESQFFLLNYETLEGTWHPFIKHPLATDESFTIDTIENISEKLEHRYGQHTSTDVFRFFDSLTSKEAGIFHVWDEQDSYQLPLSQCYIQVATPLSDGPAPLLPLMTRSGLTHNEARREAGLTGIETYVAEIIHRLIPEHNNIGIGAGETMTEGFYRALQQHLNNKLYERQSHILEELTTVDLIDIQDKHCRFYYDALSTIHETPKIAMSEEILSFPVVWVGINDRWYGASNINMTLALRNALQLSLFHVQNEEIPYRANILPESSIILYDTDSFRVEIQAEEEIPSVQSLQLALQHLEEHNFYPFVFDLAIEPFLKENLDGVYGVLIAKEDGL
ncbi:putative thiazole-containing bacteriocin maturation protein [Bacillus cereus]|uniref:putative thiazole-containing bacteriocin maturation protein n=1 Tax=Bacillus cereus TaxID=1396 RepID=UPI000BF7276A|nr:putative thiazole-containing bacteriocin maturation protein [Bacillus cereus]MDG1565861.1 putative thiazole-containing bacteriocin maturation protein [Bacillus cereus]PEX27252.1 putative thiazole-containing bacteriocin maturation protein [Bacillus cereus]PFT92389.1 putative thiazole-containing bacteriocin maturation protein [Bacillus cereus]PGP01636.1 putative thiazole-containing bacteriocin maturation protein [Bacillus cereus]